MTEVRSGGESRRERLEVRYTPTLADARACRGALLRAAPTTLVWIVVVVVAMTAFAALLAPDGTKRALYVGGGGICLAWICYWMVVAAPRAAAWGVGRERSVVFSPEGFCQVTHTGVDEFRWSDLDLRPHPDVVVALHLGRVVLTLPRAYLTERDLGAVVAWWGAERSSVPAVPAGDLLPGSEVSEQPDGALVVRGTLTPARALAVTTGAFGRGWLLVAAALAALTVPGVAFHAWRPALFTAVLALAALVMHVLLPRIGARKLLALCGGARVAWEYTPQGLSLRARFSTTMLWSNVSAVAVREEMLLVTPGSGGFAFGLVAPLTPVQLERVLGWARDATGETVATAR